MRLQAGETSVMPLAGRVVDRHGQPVAGVRVLLDHELWVQSQSDGAFVFADRAPGLYRLAAVKDDLCVDTMLVTLHEGRAPVVLTILPGITLRARVIDGDDPVPGARLLMWKEFAVGVTGDDGVALVRGVGPNFQMFEIVADGFAPTFLSMSLAPDPGGTIERTVTLRRGAPLGGIVLDPDGQPVADAEVRVWGGSWGKDTRTDADGAWRLAAVAAGTYEVTAFSTNRAVEPSTILELDGVTPRTNVAVRVARGGTITGTVTDSIGAGVGNAEVIATDGESGARRDERVVRCDGEGRFTMAGVKAGQYDLFAHHGARASPAARLVASDGEVLAADLVVTDAAIGGVVVDGRGNPVAGAAVSAYTPVVRGDLTDQQGRFFLGGFSPGRHRIIARLAGNYERAPAAEVYAAPGDTDVRVVLPAPATIRGRVVFEGRPLHYFGALVTASARLPWMGRPSSIRTDDGRFAIDGVAPGVWGLVLAGPGTAMRTIDAINVDEGGTIELGDIELRRGQRITGRVVDGAGGPIAEARVVIGRSPEDDYERERLHAWFHGESEAVSASDGTFAFDGITSLRLPNARPTPIWASHPDHGASVCVAVPEGDSVLELVVAPTGTIVGEIDGFSADFGFVAAHRRGEPADLRIATVKPSGAFVIDRVPPGDYVIVMTIPLQAPTPPPVTVSVVAATRVSVRLVMPRRG